MSKIMMTFLHTTVVVLDINPINWINPFRYRQIREVEFNGKFSIFVFGIWHKLEMKVSEKEKVLICMCVCMNKKETVINISVIQLSFHHMLSVSNE